MANRTVNKTYPPAFVFHLAALGLLLILLAALCGCRPRQAEEEVAGEYLASSSKMYGNTSNFDIRDTVVYPEAVREGLGNPSINVSDKELTFNRCTWCHECGFQAAFDWEHYGTQEWSPKYTGQAWQAPIQRMMRMENSFLQEEQIAKRIYQYLRDETLGVYDEEADDKNAIIIEVDELPESAQEGDEAGAAGEDGGTGGDAGGAAEPPADEPADGGAGSSDEQASA
ncbi:hypothetical protein JW859_11530 [bacterium]|nr:hypothetical protein [bacterium]